MEEKYSNVNFKDLNSKEEIQEYVKDDIALCAAYILKSLNKDKDVNKNKVKYAEKIWNEHIANGGTAWHDWQNVDKFIDNFAETKLPDEFIQDAIEGNLGSPTADDVPWMICYWINRVPATCEHVREYLSGKWEGCGKNAAVWSDPHYVTEFIDNFAGTELPNAFIQDAIEGNLTGTEQEQVPWMICYWINRVPAAREQVRKYLSGKWEGCGKNAAVWGGLHYVTEFIDDFAGTELPNEFIQDAIEGNLTGTEEKQVPWMICYWIKRLPRERNAVIRFLVDKKWNAKHGPWEDSEYVTAFIAEFAASSVPDEFIQDAISGNLDSAARDDGGRCRDYWVGEWLWHLRDSNTRVYEWLMTTTPAQELEWRVSKECALAVFGKLPPDERFAAANAWGLTEGEVESCAPRHCRDESIPGYGTDGCRLAVNNNYNSGVYLWMCGYDVRKFLGAGSFGVVWDCVNPAGEHVAVKVLCGDDGVVGAEAANASDLGELSEKWSSLASGSERKGGNFWGSLLSSDYKGAVRDTADVGNAGMENNTRSLARYLNITKSTDRSEYLIESELAKSDLEKEALTKLKNMYNKKKNYRSLPAMLRKARQGAKSIAALHALGWSHNDVKPENFLSVENENKCKTAATEHKKPHKTRAKLADFGLMSEIKVGVSCGGTPLFSAPDHADCDSLDVIEKRDVYSLGKTYLYFIYPNYDVLDKMEEVLLRIIKTKKPADEDREELYTQFSLKSRNWLKYYDPKYKKVMLDFLVLIARMLKPSHTDRIPIEKVVTKMQKIAKEAKNWSNKATSQKGKVNMGRRRVRDIVGWFESNMK